MIGIIDYKVGNLASVKNALEKSNTACFISADPTQLAQADGLILPGDGAAQKGMENLKEVGLDSFIKEEVKRGKPFLGICLGMQIVLSYSQEGSAYGLDLIAGDVEKFHTDLKIPQIGWNQVRIKQHKKSILFNKIPDNSYFYFIHSYSCKPKETAIITGTTDYGESFCSAFEKDYIFGVQFHPEKSGEVGLQLLNNFCSLLPLPSGEERGEGYVW